jgi:hypothetical protein
MNTIAVFILVSCLAGCMIAPHRSTVRRAVSGTVSDAETGAPISGAHISYLIPQTQFRASATSGTNGAFRIGPLRQWHWLIYAGSPGRVPEPAFWDCQFLNAHVTGTHNGYESTTDVLPPDIIFTNWISQTNWTSQMTNNLSMESDQIELHMMRTKPSTPTK